MILEKWLNIIISDLAGFSARVGKALTLGLNEQMSNYDDGKMALLILGCTCVPLTFVATSQIKISRKRKKIVAQISASRLKISSLNVANKIVSDLLTENQVRYNQLLDVLDSNKSVLTKIRNSLEVVAANKQLAPEMRTKVLRVIRTIQNSLQFDNEWNNFRGYFEKVDELFIAKLKHKFPTLSPNEIKLCSLYRMNLSYEDVAATLEISVESARVMKHRLKKRLGIPTNTDLYEFLTEIDKSEKHEVSIL